MGRDTRNRGKTIDNVFWDFAVGSQLALSAGSAAKEILSVGTTPTTILRIRGEIIVYVDAASAPGLLASLTWGLHLVPGGTGSTVLRNPLADGGASWMGFGVAYVGYEESVTDVVAVQGLGLHRFVIDVKSMRRKRPDEELQLVFTNTTQGSALAMNIAYGLRVLRGN